MKRLQIFFYASRPGTKNIQKEEIIKGVANAANVYFISNFLSLPFSLLNKKYLSQTKNIQKENVIKEVVTTYYIKYYYSNIIMLVVDKKFTYTTALDTYFRSLPILCQERMNFIFVFLKSP